MLFSTKRNTVTQSSGDLIQNQELERLVDHERMSKCPVDYHEISKPPENHDQASKCPVNDESREIWMQQQAGTNSARSTSLSSDSNATALSTVRQVSSIPYGMIHTDLNDQHVQDGPISDEIDRTKSKYWIYPSEKMFYESMKRKKWDPNAADMSSIVPIHNAVNEQAWRTICNWEKDLGSESCGGPRLLRFNGDASKITPKARFLSLLGYKLPFDRHDWTISRCSETIDYVIDFYTAKSGPHGEPGFYIDVRPKLDSWIGIKTRAQKFFG